MSRPRRRAPAVPTWPPSWRETGTTNGALPCRLSRNAASSTRRAVTIVRYIERRSSGERPSASYDGSVDVRVAIALTLASAIHVPWSKAVQRDATRRALGGYDGRSPTSPWGGGSATPHGSDLERDLVRHGPSPAPRPSRHDRASAPRLLEHVHALAVLLLGDRSPGEPLVQDRSWVLGPFGPIRRAG